MSQQGESERGHVAGPLERSVALLGRVRARVGRWCKGGLGSSWVVAVSGGSDSVGLLQMLHALAPELSLKLSVAHLNHSVRGEAAEADAQFVASLAESLGLPFDLGCWHPTRSGHFEADARRARYDWLTQVASARCATVVAVGHTRDEQAETILQRILRGTGPRGLAGMPRHRPLAPGVTLVRPLLEVSRPAIQEYLSTIGQTYRDDASNADLSRTRARIRHDLLPRLAAEYNPKVAEAVLRLGLLSGATHRALQSHVERLAHAAIVSQSTSQGRVTLLRAQVKDLPLVLCAEVLRLVWRLQGWPEAHMGAKRWKRLAALVHRERGRFSIGGGVDAWLSGDFVELSPTPEDSASTRVTQVKLALPGSAIWGAGRIVATFDANEPRDDTIDFARLDLVWDSSRSTPFLVIEAPKNGDRFEPLGMDGHSMSLNDFLRGRHVPHAQRRHVPLLVDKLGIVWVAGHRIAHRVRLTEATEQKLGLRWEPFTLETTSPGGP